MLLLRKSIAVLLKIIFKIMNNSYAFFDKQGHQPLFLSMRQQSYDRFLLFLKGIYQTSDRVTYWIECTIQVIKNWQLFPKAEGRFDVRQRLLSVYMDRIYLSQNVIFIKTIVIRLQLNEPLITSQGFFFKVHLFKYLSDFQNDRRIGNVLAVPLMKNKYDLSISLMSFRQVNQSFETVFKLWTNLSGFLNQKQALSQSYKNYHLQATKWPNFSFVSTVKSSLHS